VPRKPVALPNADARRLWLHAQRLDQAAPFGSGPEATRAAVEHLGYVQIDTINVIERCHHHILHTRIPGYERAHLHQAQSVDKSVFEYWTHALSYIPTRDYRFYRRAMKLEWEQRSVWFAGAGGHDPRKVMRRIRRDGALSIREIDDDVLVEKDHAWASRKPSKKALQIAFYKGDLVISQRSGMLKTYELTRRHFGWERAPKAASERETLNYLLDRALRSQGLVSLDSICHLAAPRKAAIHKLIEGRVRRKLLVPVKLDGAGKHLHWATPASLEAPPPPPPDELIHILSPFDPLIIQRKRTKLFFGYDHVFEAYVPRDKRKFGYFALPVLVGDRIVAALDLKTDREKGRLLHQQWTWIDGARDKALKRRIEDTLDRFERFQLAR
jgi:uncharacterized protein